VVAAHAAEVFLEAEILQLQAESWRPPIQQMSWSTGKVWSGAKRRGCVGGEMRTAAAGADGEGHWGGLPHEGAWHQKPADRTALSPAWEGAMTSAERDVWLVRGGVAADAAGGAGPLERLLLSLPAEVESESNGAGCCRLMRADWQKPDRTIVPCPDLPQDRLAERRAQFWSSPTR